MPQASGLDLKLLNNLQNHSFLAAEQDILSGANIDAHFDLGHGMYSSVLTTMAYTGNVKAVELLIKYHVNLNERNALGETILESLTNTIGTIPNGERKENLVQIINILTEESAKNLCMHDFGKSSLDLVDESFIDSSLQEVINRKINAATGLEFISHKNGDMVLNLTPEQMINVNKFSFTFPEKANKLFPNELNVRLSTKDNQLVLGTNELQGLSGVNSRVMETIIKTLEIHKQIFDEVMKGNFEAAVKDMDLLETQEKLGAIVQSYGLKNLLPQKTQIEMAQQNNDINSQLIGAISKSGGVGLGTK